MSDIIGSRIKEQRKNKHYTQLQLAKKISVSPQVISNWERGYTEPSAEDIARLSEVLSCPSDYLLGKSTTDAAMKENNKLLKEERDIAKRMDELRDDLSNATGLLFNGEPMSEEAKESLLEAMEFGIRLAKKNNKKFIPKNYRDKEE
ncbi:helix-turn-helix domain-containing protein [Lysinibacillus sphaericus]|uniref:helix-turn-helix domain-containing protein n=1 Tax=Lysinibacillus sphaericus TaxID=1421 RepID=UPI0006898344|nr:helix-turn-helix transcriptional regulator [Lysinibacillus sphaericus]QPA60650.1 helix-turn-helix transcriptional regulator [Lysinibacillus sphaericus]